jgi:phosphoesterase RecJ-like protein
MTVTPTKTPLPNEKHPFRKDFHTLSHIIDKSESFLLVAHNRPDPDTIGSVSALFFSLIQRKKSVVIVCHDPFPEDFSTLLPGIVFVHPDIVDITSFDVVLACDSVERGFSSLVLPKINTDKQITVLIDHHPNICIKADITIIDSNYSSACELLSEFFFSQNIPVNHTVATALLLGILGDTGNFQHANTNARVLKTTAKLLARGASIQKISSRIFSNKKLGTLRLWGRAFEKAKMEDSSKMITTALTKEDLLECNASPEDISHVANMLATIPGTRFALILTQCDDYHIKGSLRAEPSQCVDVSKIARRLGGGGHALASGFEIRGKLVDNPDSWVVL